jgi:hypothetical protein
MAGSPQGGVDLEAVGTRGESLHDLACHYRQVPYLLFGAPLGRAGGGESACRLVERVLGTHLSTTYKAEFLIALASA